MKRTHPKTFDDLKARNYTIYLAHSERVDFRGLLLMIEERRRFKYILKINKP